MKTIKLLIAILLFSPLFIACEADSVENENVSLENVDVFGDEDDDAGEIERQGEDDDAGEIDRGGN